MGDRVAARTRDVVVRATGVDKIYSSQAERVVAVGGVTLSVHEGEFVCLMGPSGCGKSTLLNLLAGLDRPDSGSVEVCGVVLDDLTDAERAAHRLATTGYVFQEHRLLPELTAVENVMLPLEVAGRRVAEAERTSLAALATVGLDGLGRRYPDELSGGQRQRVGVARALVGGRRLILADEATGALDSETSRSIYQLLAELAADGTTVVAASHDPEVAHWATRIVTMRDGVVVRDEESPSRSVGPDALAEAHG
ncbi:ABC transporter ATP-binding protein [Sanguibacter massiliensis]|uniref:ABC transporter ATP-binding protein n=1 Tax=Sanguibacter massiliensis TaxID=1973217 RepID=UPI000C82819B|nr:ABC transporter ATP-binding protein [Sanguibacter massiliensis]